MASLSAEHRHRRNLYVYGAVTVLGGVSGASYQPGWVGGLKACATNTYPKQFQHLNYNEANKGIYPDGMNKPIWWLSQRYADEQHSAFSAVPGVFM